MQNDTQPKFAIFADTDCSGNSTGVVAQITETCVDFGAYSAISNFVSYTNILGPPKSMILYQGRLNFGYPDYDAFKIGSCHNFSPNVLSFMEQSLVGIVMTEYPDRAKGSLCSDGIVNPNVPDLEEHENLNVTMSFYENLDCSGKSVSVGLQNEQSCDEFPLEHGLFAYTNTTKSDSPYRSYKLDYGSTFLMLTPSGNWVSVESTGCNVVPKDVLADLQNNIKANNTKGFQTQDRFCAAKEIKVKSAVTTTTAATPSNHPSSSDIVYPNMLLLIFLIIAKRKAAAMQPPKRIYQPSRSNYNAGLKGEHFVLVSQSGSDNTRSFKFESPRKIAENKPGLGVISPFKDSSFSPLNLQDDLFKPKTTFEKKTVVPESATVPDVPISQHKPQAIKEFKSPYPIKVSMDTPVKVHVDTPRPFLETKSYAPVTPSPLVRVTNTEDLELDSGEIADVSSEVKVEKRKVKSTSTPIRKKKSAGRATKKTPVSVRKGVTSVRSRVGLFESLNDTTNNQKVEEYEIPVEIAKEKPLEMANKSKRKFEEDEFPENLLPEDGFSWQLGDNVRLKKKIKTKQAEETIVKKRIEFFKNLGFDITKSTELSQEQAPGRLPISSTEDGAKKRLRKELDEDELDEITINRLKKESPAKRVDFAVPEITVKKVDFNIPEKTDTKPESGKPAFKLPDVSKNDTTDTKSTFSFGKAEEKTVENSKPPLPKSDNKDEAKPAFTFGNPVETVASAPTFSFGKTETAPKPEQKKDTLTTIFGKPEEKEAPKPAVAFSFNKPAEAKEGDKSSTFSFGKPVELTPAPTTAPALSFGKPAELTPAPTTAPALSFGKPAESKRDSAAPLFKVPESKPESGITSKITPALSFGKPAETVSKDANANNISAAPAFSLGNPADTEKKNPPGFSFGKPTETSTPSFSFGKPAESQETKTTSTFTFGKPAETKETTTAPSFSFGKPTEAKQPEVKETANVNQNGAAFGQTPNTTFSFGQSNSTAASVPTFGQTPAATTTNNSAPAFSFGQPPAPANTTNAAVTFGKPNEPAKTSTLSFGGFGQTTNTSAPSFGQTQAPTFGQSTPAPAFGQGNTASTFGENKPGTPAFGQTNNGPTSTPAFGATNNPPTFGQPTSTAPTFGQSNTNTAGTFGQTSNAPAFGAGNTFGQSNTSTNTIGQTNTFGNSAPSFGAASTTFGSTTKQPATTTFNSTTTQPAATTFNSTTPAQTNTFGNQNNSIGFGASQPGQTGFGAQNTFGQPGNTTTPAPAFGSTFGNNSTPSFGQTQAPTFGQSTPAPPFGQTTNSTASTFGQPAAPAFGNSNQANAGFNFQAPAGAPSFNFGASAPPSFQFGAGNPQPSQIPPPNMNRPMATPKFRRGPKGGRR
ncbi:hypothetical protein HDV06_001501 [Boothiomyces sp. JEL0866]|nr:hypothetical protein HDV06_001501 [Boothiomyces sp. JEL0866]